MDNCAVNMLSFSGIYTNSIHARLVNPDASEKQLLRVNRVASVLFAMVSIVLSFLFTDVPAAMRFLWQTVPLMGITWFFAILWKRCNRYGAIASFVAALAASGVANFVLNWTGDAGLPYTILLYLCCGIGAGVLVSLLTPPESPARTEQFFLLLRTPIGQEHVLREAGFRELPGNDTYEMPIDADEEVEGRGFDVIRSAEPEMAGGVGGVATAVQVVPTRLKVAEAAKMIDNRDARRQSVAGFIALTALVALMLIGIKVLATWLAP
jgi:Na+/proline symporter